MNLIDAKALITTKAPYLLGKPAQSLLETLVDRFKRKKEQAIPDIATKQGKARVPTIKKALRIESDRHLRRLLKELELEYTWLPPDGRAASSIQFTLERALTKLSEAELPKDTPEARDKAKRADRAAKARAKYAADRAEQTSYVNRLIEQDRKSLLYTDDPARWYSLHGSTATATAAA